MIDEVRFVLAGKPQTKSRPRFTRHGRTYTDAKTRVAEQSLLAAYLIAAGNRPPHTGPVFVTITASFVPPMSWANWKRERAMNGEWAHTTKPDLDNIVKLLDGLNGRAWVDDAQIVGFFVTKRYAAAASTEITLTFVPEPTKD